MQVAVADIMVYENIKIRDGCRLNLLQPKSLCNQILKAKTKFFCCDAIVVDSDRQVSLDFWGIKFYRLKK